MPFTPFHFGPGALLSVVSPSRVSFLAFCAANVLIDVESLYSMLTRQPRIHAFFHTYVGASLAGLAVILIFIPARWIAMRLPDQVIFRWKTLSIAAVGLGAMLGAVSHVALDSIMHADITPLAPFSQANGLYRIISLTSLHWLCVASGVLALGWRVIRSNDERQAGA